MAVTRCVCYRHTLARLKQLAERNGWTSLAEISAHTKCGTGCGGCRPYIEAMLSTGHTCFAPRQSDAPPQPCEPDPWDQVE